MFIINKRVVDRIATIIRHIFLAKEKVQYCTLIHTNSELECTHESNVIIQNGFQHQHISKHWNSETKYKHIRKETTTVYVGEFTNKTVWMLILKFGQPLYWTIYNYREPETTQPCDPFWHVTYNVHLLPVQMKSS